MTIPPFSIVNIRDGARRDVEPFLPANDSFPEAIDCYFFRGRIPRKSCFKKQGVDGRLKGKIGTTDAAGNFAFTLQNTPLVKGISTFYVGATRYTDPDTIGGALVALLTTGPGTATLDRTTGAVNIAGGPALTDVFYVPSLPVMGLRTKEEASINDEAYIQFDTRYSYRFDNTADDFLFENLFKFTGAPFIWHGSDSDFFWTSNYRQAMWTTNNIPGLNSYAISAGTNVVNSSFTAPAGHNITINDYLQFFATGTTLDSKTFLVTNVVGNTITINNTTVAPGSVYSGAVIALTRPVTTAGQNGDGIKWYDGTPNPGKGWVNFVPPIGAPATNRLLRGALCIVAYKDRLLALNTFEAAGNTLSVVNFAQRARWSQNGTPYYYQNNAIPPVSQTDILPLNQGAQFDAWVDDTPGKGGFIDAPTNEQIVGCEFIKDTLIVYFERSTWQLIYTGNEVLPFIWQKINTELGSESTFSTVPFDQGVFAIGNYGVTTCNSVNVARIDEKIPDDVFNFYNGNNGVNRVHGIRDYTFQLVYWTFPLDDQQPAFPNRVLVYNYLDGSWSTFIDSFTCYGYIQPARDLRWQDATFPWDTANFAWNSGLEQSKYPDIIAGNQVGFVMKCNQSQQSTFNDLHLLVQQVTNATNTILSPNHNLEVNQYVMIEGAQGVTGLNGIVFRVSVIVDANNIILDNPGIAGTYTGGGTMRVIPNFDLVTKLFNPFYQIGKSMRLDMLEILMDRTTVGQINIDYYPNYSLNLAVQSTIVNTKPDAPGTFQDVEDKIWHRVYTSLQGSFVQLSLNMSDAQMRDIDIARSNIVIQGINLYFSPAGRLII